jgi:integrase
MPLSKGRAGDKAPKRPKALDPEMVALLKAHVNQLKQRALAAGAHLDNSCYLFPASDDGRTPTRGDALSRRFRELRDDIGVPSTVRFHDLRHYAITEMLRSGIPLEAVAVRADHANSAMTAKVYSHWRPADDQAAADVGGRILARRRSSAS